MRVYQKAFSLIELMIGLAILGLLVAAGVPSMRNWIQSSEIRASAESIQNGLQLARTESVRRNVNVRFQLTTAIDSSCLISVSGNSWVVSLDDPTTGCSAPLTANSGVIQSYSNKDGSPNVVVSSTQSTVFFNGLGRQASGTVTTGVNTPDPTAIVTIDVTNPTGGACAADGGAMRCMRVVVTTGGNVKMCDPALPSTDSQGC